MNLTSPYLGLTLPTPFIIGASPLADDIGTVRVLADLGAGAIVLRSLFEEQIYLAALERAPALKGTEKLAGPGAAYFPAQADYQMSPDAYLDQIKRLKDAVSIPIIASLNGCRPGGWIDFARLFEKAGADAIELNLYHLAVDPSVTGLEVEADMLETLRLIKGAVTIPVSAKLSPFHSSLSNFARQLERGGADGIVLFNRFYQAGLDADEERDDPRLELSDSSELTLRLRWLTLLSPFLKASLGAAGGVHRARDAVKAIAAGADAVQLVSVLLRHGPRILSTLTAGLAQWLDDHGYSSVAELRDSLNLQRCPDPAGQARGEYQRILQAWRL